MMAKQGQETVGPDHGSKRKNSAEDTAPRKAIRRLPPKSKDEDTSKRHSKLKSVENTSAGGVSKSNDFGARPLSHSLVDQIIASSTLPPNVERHQELLSREDPADNIAGPSAFRKLGDVLYSKVQDVIAHNAILKAARNLLKRSKESDLAHQTSNVQECASQGQTNSASETQGSVHQKGKWAYEQHGSKKHQRKSRARTRSSVDPVAAETKSRERQCSIPTAYETATKSTTSATAWHVSLQRGQGAHDQPSPSSPVLVNKKVPTRDVDEHWTGQDPAPQLQNYIPGAHTQGGSRLQGTSTEPLQPQNAAVQPSERTWDEDEEMEDLSETITQFIGEQQPLVDYRGIYLITDTNVFLHNLDLVKKIINADTGSTMYIVCVPWIVVQELDRIRNHKTDKKSLSAAAFKAILYINKMLETRNPKLRGQTVAEARGKEAVMPQSDFDTNDDHLLYCCLSLKHQGSRVIMMTNDTNLRNKALIHDVESYKADVVEKNLKSILANAPVEMPTEACADTKPPPVIVQQGCEAVWQEVTATLQRCLSLVLETELRSALGNDWIAEVAIKPPWTACAALECALKHWTDCHLLPSSAFNCTIQPSIKKLRKIVRETEQGVTLQVSSEKLEELFRHTVKVCSHLQLHYFQLVEEVAVLKHLQTSWQQHTKTEPTVTSQRDGIMSAPRDQHNAVATLRALLKTGREEVPRPPPQPLASAVSPPVQQDEHAMQCILLLQSSWSLINDYCGTVCRQVSVSYAFPYQENPCFVSNLASLQTVYKYVYQTREHMERLLKRTTQDTLHDVASLFLEILQRITNILQRKMGVPETRFEVSSSCVAQFFADKSRRELIDNGYKQIVTFQDALGYCLLDATKLESANVRRTPPPFSSRANLRN